MFRSRRCLLLAVAVVACINLFCFLQVSNWKEEELKLNAAELTFMRKQRPANHILPGKSWHSITIPESDHQSSLPTLSSTVLPKREEKLAARPVYQDYTSFKNNQIPDKIKKDHSTGSSQWLPTQKVRKIFLICENCYLCFLFLIVKTITISTGVVLPLGELCLLGQKVTTQPFGIIWPQVWPFI